MPSWRTVTYAAGSGAVIGGIVARFPKQVAKGGFKIGKVGARAGFRVGRVAGRALAPAALAFIAFQAARAGIRTGREEGVVAGIETGIATGVSEATFGIISVQQAKEAGRAAGSIQQHRFKSPPVQPVDPLISRAQGRAIARGIGGLFSPTSR